MRILKRFLIGLLAIVVLLLVVALFVKKDFAVQREVVINRPSQDVFNYIKYLKNQEDYGVWTKMDPNIKKTYTGTDGTVGFTYAWEGNSDVGKGEQKITGITEGKRIDMALHFIEPFESTSPAYISTEKVTDAQTKVTWGLSGRMVYPLNIMGLFMNMDNAIGKDFQTGLDNMKAILEKQ